MRSIIFGILPALGHKYNSVTQTFLLHYDEGICVKLKPLLHHVKTRLKSLRT